MNRSLHRFLAAGCLLISSLSLQAQTLPEPKPVPGHSALKPAEHPRLLFRAADVPELRRKAQTPEGQAMITRLKVLLGGGEAMPKEFNPHPPLNIGPKGPRTLKPGAFTVNHGAGFGLLYQLTGNQKYADLALQCVDKVFSGQVDRDERYSWTKPGTGFRISGVLQGVALAYDLCYEAWSPQDRMRVLKEIQSVAPMSVNGKRGPFTLEFISSGGKYPPSSNHYGAYIAGGGFGALATLSDPGSDDARMKKVLSTVDRSIQTLLTKGFGDYGWFGEGAGSDKTAIQPGVTGLFQAMKVAQGRDWAAGSSNARHIVLTRLLEAMYADNGVIRPPRGYYSHGDYFWDGGRRDRYVNNGGWSNDGLFSIGFGVVPEKYQPGLLWIYETYAEPNTPASKRIYEARIDPLHAVYAFVNWPVGMKAEDPSAAWPLAIHDSIHGYVLARNGFDPEKSILFTGLCRIGPVGYHKVRAQQDVWIWGMEYKVSMDRFGRAGISDFKSASDGSVTFKNGETAFAVDFSAAAGCEAVIVRYPSKGVSVVPPQDPTANAVADGDINLSGRWNDGVRMEQKGTELVVYRRKPGKPEKEFGRGSLQGRTVAVEFGKNKNLIKGELSADSNKIEWENNTQWHRGKAKRWKYAQGDKVKTHSLSLGENKISVVTFAANGQHPEVSLDGSQIRVGKQVIPLQDGALKLPHVRVP